MDNELLELVESYNEYLVQLEAGLDILVTLFKESNESLNERIIELNEGLSWLYNINLHLSNLNLTTKLNAKELNQILIELTDALANHDYNHSSEIIEYELIPYVGNIGKVEAILEN